jgi:hypothetical protein
VKKTNPTSSFARNTEIAKFIAKGNGLKATAEVFGITANRAREIFGRASYHLWNYISDINRQEVRLGGKVTFMLDLVSRVTYPSTKAYVDAMGWLYQLPGYDYINPDIDRTIIHDLLLVWQDEFLKAITEDHVEVVKYAFFSKDGKLTYEGSKYTDEGIELLTPFVCFRIDPRAYTEISFRGGRLTFRELKAYRRVFFDPIDIDLSKLVHPNLALLS